MIRVKSVLKSYEIPNSWLDISYNDYIKLTQFETPLEQVKHLTKMNEFELANIAVQLINEALKFLHEPIDEIEPTNYVNDEVILPVDIGEEPFHKKIEAVEAVKSNDIIQLIKTYSDIDVSSFNCYHVFGLFNYLIKQLEDILEREKEMLKSNLTKRQINAGIHEFDKLGDFNIIDMIARNYNYTHAQVEQLPYNLVFLILLKQNISSKFEEKYNELSHDSRRHH